MEMVLIVVLMALFDLGLIGVSIAGMVFALFAIFLMGGGSPFIALLGLASAGLLGAVAFGVRVLLPAMQDIRRSA